MGRVPYQKLEIWKKGMDLSKLLYAYTKVFPPEERYGLRAQMRGAAVSIPSNIAEGSRRGSDREFANFILIARGSLAELETQILLAHAFAYLSNERKDELMQKCEELSKMLRAFHDKLSG